MKQTQGICYNKGRKVPGELGLGWDGSPPPPPARQNLLSHNPGPPEGLGTLSSWYVCYVATSLLRSSEPDVDGFTSLAN